MATARVLSVSTGRIKDMLIEGYPDHSAIDKRPVTGRVQAGWLGLDGDEHGDAESHGGADQALYAYGREDLDWWTEQLGRELPDGGFGENLTTVGIDVNAAGRPGAYLRVLTEGEIGAGDPIEVLDRPAQRVTVTESMRAYYGDQDLMRTLLTVPGRGSKWDEIGEHVLARMTA